MKKLLALFILTAAVLTAIPCSSTYAAEIDVSAPSAVLMDYNTGQILYEKNGDQKMYPASVTKILTAIIALENSNLNDSVTAGDDVLNTAGNKIYISPGEVLSMKDLVYSLLISSANDSAIVIADHISGSVDDFAEMMNEKAAEIGAKNTHFTNPNGLHDDDHYTTAKDMAMIARYAMKNKTFRTIVTTPKYVIQPTNKFDKVRELYPENKLLLNSKYKYEGADGVKTGYTTKSDHTLVASATRDGHRLIAVIMGAKGTAVWEDAIKLLDYGYDNYSLVTINEKDQIVTAMKLKNLEIPLKTDEKFIAAIPDGKKDITKKIRLDEEVSFPIQSGAVLGKLEYYIDGKLIGKVDLITDNTYQRSWFGKVNQVNAAEKNNPNRTVRILLVILILLLAALILELISHLNRHKRYIFKKTSR